MTVQEMQSSLKKAIDFVETVKPLTMTQDGQPMAMLLSFKEGSELLRLRHVVRLEGYFAARLKNRPQGVSELSMDDMTSL